MEKILFGVLDSAVPFRYVPFSSSSSQFHKLAVFFLVLTTSNVLCIEVL